MTQHGLFVNVVRSINGQDLPLPNYATSGSSGMDLLAAINDNEVLRPGERKLIPTGIAIGLPHGFEAQIRPRSGLAIKHGITVTNAPGTIDSDYRGEIFVSLINLSKEDFVIEKGMRIAQMVIAKYEIITWELVNSLDETARGTGAFGSTGLK